MRGLAGQTARNQHDLQFGGRIWYVNGTSGNDAYNGIAPDSPFATIGAALAVALAGDAINVATGDYDEAGLDLALDGMDLIGELGVTLRDTTPGTPLTVSGDGCRVVNIEVEQAGAVGIAVTGSRCYFENCGSRQGTTAWDIDNTSNQFHLCGCGQYTVTGWDLGAGGNRLYDCLATGLAGATRGFYVSAGPRNRLFNCVSSGNVTAGFETAETAIHSVFSDCTSAGDDGNFVDAGFDNSWPRFSYRTRREQHEHVYPPVSGEGVASVPVVVDNTVTDDSGGGPWSDQDYWGDIVRIIPPDTLTTTWLSLGIYIYAETALDQQAWQIYFTNYHYQCVRDGGNDWDYQETALTVDDATVVAVGDKVWITGTGALDGEICDVVDVTGSVVTIASETRISGDVGLKYDYTGAETMYVVYRPGVPLLHPIDGDYEAASAKESKRYIWAQPRLIEPDGAMLMRMANGTDASDSGMSVRAIWND